MGAFVETMVLVLLLTRGGDGVVDVRLLTRREGVPSRGCQGSLKQPAKDKNHQQQVEHQEIYSRTMCILTRYHFDNSGHDVILTIVYLKVIVIKQIYAKSR